MLVKFISSKELVYIRSDTMKPRNSNLMIPDLPIDIRISLAELKIFCCFLTLLILCPVGCLS